MMNSEEELGDQLYYHPVSQALYAFFLPMLIVVIFSVYWNYTGKIVGINTIEVFTQALKLFFQWPIGLVFILFMADASYRSYRQTKKKLAPVVTIMVSGIMYSCMFVLSL